MRDPIVTFHCASRSDPDELHTITVDNGIVLCSCVGTDWCSHIHATLIDGERNMVPFEEWDFADQAISLLRGRIKPPEWWKAHWRNDKIWRGLADRRQTAMERAIQSGKPTILFIGNGQLGNRSDYVEEATYLGWHVVETPSPLVTLVVYQPSRLGTKKGTMSIDMELPLLSFDDWDTHTYDLTEVILEAIEQHRPGPQPASDLIAA